VINLPALVSFRRLSEDLEEDQKLEEEYFRHNQEIARMIVDKGFDKFTINMFLQAGLEKEKNEK